MKAVVVKIPVANNWPSLQEIAARNQATDQLSAAGIGTCKGAGGGCGEMDFSYSVADESTARSEIDRVMHQIFPGVPYRVSVTE